MLANKWTKGLLVLFALLFLSAWAWQTAAWARAGSGGSRGSRSMSAPRPYTAPRPTQPSQPAPGMGSTTPPGSQPSGFMRSFGGGLLGGLAGGLLFHSLFGGSAYGGMGGLGGSGISLIEILLLAGIGYLIYRFINRRRQPVGMAAGGYYQGGGTSPAYQAGVGSTYQIPYAPAYDQPQIEAGDRDLEQGLANIRQFDADFDEAKFQDLGMDTFFKIQGAWANRDMSTVRPLLTDEMFGILQGDADRLKAERKINRLENIAVRSVDISEAWQEAGVDYVTVRIYANLLDYNVDETTGQVVEGSKIEPVKFEEYWTFTRPVGHNPWQLAAIQQPG